MARNSQRTKNNNPTGRNQYSNSWIDGARDRPMTTALGAAAAVGAGVFLWSRRNQISEQLSSLSDQISEWSENRGSNREFEFADSGSSMSTASRGSAANGSSGNLGTKSRGSRTKPQSEIAEEAMSLKQTGVEA